MAPDQMGMSAPAISPDQFAVFDQMRQQVSPKEFSDEVLAGASQIDPQAVAEFTKELQSAEITPEELEELNNVVDAILANPEQYDQIRERYISQGLEEDLLPEKFDPFFFAALNMAVDQLIAAPAGPQAFAKGGIAELKPIAKALADYGRNGDTMLAHITPAEARMLRRRGGSGTINPHTGLPEFFLKKAFKKVAQAVKKFASSTVGRIVTTVALGFFLGPAAASMLGTTSAAGVAAVSGFVGSAGSTLAAGGNLRDALKAGAIGGLTAGAGAAVSQGAAAFQAGSASTAGMTAGQALQNQVDKFTTGVKNLVGGAAPAPVPAAAPVPGEQAAPFNRSGMTPQQMEAAVASPGAAAPVPAPAPNLAVDATAAPGSLAKPAPASPSLFDSTKEFINKNISPSGIREQAIPGAQQAGQSAVEGLMARIPDATPAMKEAAYQSAFKAAMPGVLATYGPAVATGLGATALAGGFKSKEPELSPTARELLDRDKNRPKIEDRPDLFYIQGLPGVKYDEKGRIIGSTPWQPSATMEDIRVPAAGMSGIGSLNPPMYTPEAGAIGAGRGISQPYNTSSMYGNVMRPTPMPQIPFPGLNAPSMPGLGGGVGMPRPITTMPYPGDMFTGYGGGYGGGLGTPGFAEGGEVEDPEYMMHGGVAHMFGGGLMRRIVGRVTPAIANQQAQMQAQMAQQAQQAQQVQQAAAQERQLVDADRQARAAQFGAGMQPRAAQMIGAMSPDEVERQARAARFAQMLQAPSQGAQAPSQMPQMPMLGGMASPHPNIDGRGFMAAGGLASLAQGGYPRRTGQISGPGTEKSDSIPAMLSDGEFVMTAKAVRGAGNGSRRAGAKKMYALMHQLERNASRG